MTWPQRSSSLEREQIRKEQRAADMEVLREVVMDLPSVHPEKAGLIRAIEILRHEKIDAS